MNGARGARSDAPLGPASGPPKSAGRLARWAAPLRARPGEGARGPRARRALCPPTALPWLDRGCGLELAGVMVQGVGSAGANMAPLEKSVKAGANPPSTPSCSAVTLQQTRVCMPTILKGISCSCLPVGCSNSHGCQPRLCLLRRPRLLHRQAPPCSGCSVRHARGCLTGRHSAGEAQQAQPHCTVAQLGEQAQRGPDLRGQAQVRASGCTVSAGNHSIHRIQP